MAFVPIDITQIKLDKPDYSNPEVRNAAIVDLYGEQPTSQVSGFIPVDINKVKLDEPQAQMQAQPKEEPSISRTALEQGLQGATFGFSDEIMNRIGALIASKVTGEDYGKLLDEATKTTSSRMKSQVEENPVTSIVSNIGGALLTGGAGASTKAGSAVASRLASGNLAARMGKAALAGAASGGLYGAGSAEEGQRMQGAGEGAIFGGVLGGATPAIGSAIKTGVSSVAGKIAERGTKKIAQETGELVAPELSKDYQKVYARLKADYPNQNDFKQALNSYMATKGQSLLEAGGEKTAGLAESAAQFPSGAAKSVEFFKNATGKAPDILKKTLSKTISPSTNYSDDVDTILEIGRAKAAPLYQQAFSKNQSIQSPLIDKILATPEGKTALGEAIKNIQNELSLVAKPSPELTQLAKEVSDLGLMERPAGGVASGLKLRTLDYIKKSMDDTVKQAIRAGDDAEARRITNLKNAFVNEIDSADKTGLYAKARAASGDYLSSKQAMEDGLKFLSEDAENIPRRLLNMNPAQKEAYRAGVVKVIRNSIDNKFDGRNVADLFQKPSTRQKLQAVLSKTDYNKLLSDAKSVDNIFKLRNQITGNSRTALRLMGAQEFDNEAQQFVMDAAKGGLTKAAFNKGVQYISNKFGGMKDTLASDVADILYETDPKKKYQIVKKLINQSNIEGENLKKTEAAKKLALFYTISDKMAKVKTPILPSGLIGLSQEGIQSNNPLKVTIRPQQDLPQVNLPTLGNQQ